MKAILIDTEKQSLYLGNAAAPVPGDGDLLVDVHATAVNRADILQRKGMYPPPPGASDIIGLEMAGVVEQVGGGVQHWNVGDQVCALLPGGGYAEKVVIPAEMAMRIPDGFSFEEAAAIPEVFLTAFLNLFLLGQLSAGEHVLIHAAASGVGTAAIQLAREAGAIPIATAGSAEKLNRCQSLGAKYCVNYREENFADKVLEFTKGSGVHLILDPVGASYWVKNLHSIGKDGRWVLIGGLGGTRIEHLDIMALMAKRVQLIFSTLRSRSTENKIALTKRFVEQFNDKLAARKLMPVLDKTFDWSEAMAAHAYMESNRNIGKIVLKIKA